MWRKAQEGHNVEAAEALHESPRGDFHDWVVTMYSYATMTLVNGWFELQGLGVPTKHGARRRMVELHLSDLYGDYNALRMMSEDARYGKGYLMSDRNVQEARRIYERIAKALPWPQDEDPGAGGLGA